MDVLVTGNDSTGMGQTTTLLQAVKVAVDDRLETGSVGAVIAEGVQRLPLHYTL